MTIYTLSYALLYCNWLNTFLLKDVLTLEIGDRGRVAQLLRRFATNRKVAGLIPAGVIGIFHCHKILPIAL